MGGIGSNLAEWIDQEIQKSINKSTGEHNPKIEVDLFTGLLTKRNGVLKNDFDDFLRIVYNFSRINRNRIDRSRIYSSVNRSKTSHSGIYFDIALPRNTKSINIGRVIGNTIPSGLKCRHVITGASGVFEGGSYGITTSDKGLYIDTFCPAGIYTLEITFYSDNRIEPLRVHYNHFVDNGNNAVAEREFVDINSIKINLFVTCGPAIIPERNKITQGVNVYWLEHALEITGTAAADLNENLDIVAREAREGFIRSVNRARIVNSNPEGSIEELIIQGDEETLNKIVQHNIASAIFNRIAHPEYRKGAVITQNYNYTPSGTTDLSAFRGYVQTVFSVLANLLGIGIRMPNMNFNSDTRIILLSFMVRTFLKGEIPAELNDATIIPAGVDSRPDNNIRTQLAGEGDAEGVDIIEFVTIHNTGGTPQLQGARWNAWYVRQPECTTGEGMKSWHYSVDDKIIFKSLPDGEMACHAGDYNCGILINNQRRSGGRHSIAIEICMNNNGYLLGATDNAALLTAYLCEKYDIKVTGLVGDYDVTAHVSAIAAVAKWAVHNNYNASQVRKTIADAVGSNDNAGLLGANNSLTSAASNAAGYVAQAAGTAAAKPNATGKSVCSAVVSCADTQTAYSNIKTHHFWAKPTSKNGGKKNCPEKIRGTENRPPDPYNMETFITRVQDFMGGRNLYGVNTERDGVADAAELIARAIMVEDWDNYL